MAGREIICCGPRGWVKTIAWLQIITNFIGAAASLIILLFVFIPQNFNQYCDYRFRFPEWITLGCFNMTAAGFVFGVFLLMGTNQKNTTYIKRWMIYQIVCLIVYTNLILGGVAVSCWALAYFIIPLLYTIFGIWIVRVFLVEIQPPSNEGSEQQGLPQQDMPSPVEENGQTKYASPPPYNPKMIQQV